MGDCLQGWYEDVCSSDATKRPITAPAAIEDTIFYKTSLMVALHKLRWMHWLSKPLSILVQPTVPSLGCVDLAWVELSWVDVNKLSRDLLVDLKFYRYRTQYSRTIQQTCTVLWWGATRRSCIYRIFLVGFTLLSCKYMAIIAHLIPVCFETSWLNVSWWNSEGQYNDLFIQNVCIFIGRIYKASTADFVILLIIG